MACRCDDNCSKHLHFLEFPQYPLRHAASRQVLCTLPCSMFKTWRLQKHSISLSLSNVKTFASAVRSGDKARAARACDVCHDPLCLVENECGTVDRSILPWHSEAYNSRVRQNLICTLHNGTSRDFQPLSAEKQTCGTVRGFNAWDKRQQGDSKRIPHSHYRAHIQKGEGQRTRLRSEYWICAISETGISLAPRWRFVCRRTIP